ncbi:MAG: hypothetical protein EXS55_04050 [Candidatus Magasanikbacteria bacterium]|nr:hypothetical protein [Candidatus Magasanikbacteria bacterium]
MYSPETISQIHSQLQALDPSALVLLGGSYLYGEAGEESDVDFYFVCPNWRIFFLKRLKKLINDLKQRFSEVDFTVMIVPRWLRHDGYGIYGRDTRGKIHSWALPIPTLIRNCLKLAYFNYLRSIVEPTRKDRNRLKVKKQLAVAQLAAEGKIDFNQPIFSWRHIQNHRAQNTPTSVLPLSGGGNDSPSPFRGGAGGGVFGVSEGAESLVEQLDQAFHQLLPHFTFSWPNYLLYNVKFLLRGNPLFLFKNPDKMIIERLKEGFDKKEDPVSLYREIKEIIFPVIIL